MTMHPEPTIPPSVDPPESWLAGQAAARTGATSIEDVPVGPAEARGVQYRAGDVEWERAYRPAYRTTHTSVASGMVLAARTAAGGLDDSSDPAGRARGSLSALGGVAGRVRERVQPQAGPSPGGSVDTEVPAGDLTNGVPQLASSDVGNEARLRGAVDGMLEGAREILAGWRAATPRRDRMAAFRDATVTDWVHSTLATMNRGVLRPWVSGDGPGPAAIAGLSFAQVATSTMESAPEATGPAAVTRRSGARRART